MEKKPKGLERWENGDSFTFVSFWDCDICKRKILDSDARHHIGLATICLDCSLDLASKTLDYLSWTTSIIWLKQRLGEYRGQKKFRSCYLNPQLKKEILEKYKYTCFYCGSDKNLSIDHIKPVKAGGKDILSNLQVLCRSCNSKKGAKYSE